MPLSRLLHSFMHAIWKALQPLDLTWQILEYPVTLHLFPNYLFFSTLKHHHSLLLQKFIFHSEFFQREEGNDGSKFSDCAKVLPMGPQGLKGLALRGRYCEVSFPNDLRTLWKLGFLRNPETWNPSHSQMTSESFGNLVSQFPWKLRKYLIPKQP